MLAVVLEVMQEKCFVNNGTINMLLFLLLTYFSYYYYIIICGIVGQSSDITVEAPHVNVDIM